MTKHTIFNFFAGHASPLQKKLVEDWLADSRNMEQYYEWLEEWEREQPQVLVDTPAALQQFLVNLNAAPPIATPGPDNIKPARKRLTWTAYAAAVALIIAASGWLARDIIAFDNYRTTYAQVRTITLADGTVVTLNANSSLRVPRFGFGSTTRQVYLEGEAEFSVVHTRDDKKFIVRTPDQLEVEVLGTKFIVYTRARGSKVVLNEGKVLLRSLTDTTRRTLSVRPGDVVTIHKGVFDVKEQQPVATHAAWKEHRFVFDHTSLQEIAYQVEESFGIKMQIRDSVLAKRMLTGTYEADDADELLDVLARVLDVRVSRTPEKIVVQAR